MTIELLPPDEPQLVIEDQIPEDAFGDPFTTDESVETIILYSKVRLSKFYTDEVEAAAISDLVERIEDLAAATNGVAINLDEVEGADVIVSAYDLWDENSFNPQGANYMTRIIKKLLYDKVWPAYPNLKYMVLVGDDRIIPHRRVRDETLVANERNYFDEVSTHTYLESAFQYRYILTDDYYAGVLPLEVKSREVYLPQFAIGRLVESPTEIVATIDRYLDTPVVEPDDAFVTGYDFLIDQATAISNSLGAQGVGTVNTLINNTWSVEDFGDLLSQFIVGPPVAGRAPQLVSLNSHFSHYSFYPITPTDELLTIDFVDGITPDSFTSALVFSVGCHSGLNVDDATAASAQTAADWAQTFSSLGATYFGNTGFGYGDSDLIAYSELLMLNFVEALNYDADGAGAGTQTVGEAMLNAKQRYFNELAGGTFSSYDEKVLAIMTLYGLPMQGVQMPTTTTTPPGSETQLDLLPSRGAQAGITPIALTFEYEAFTVDRGMYYEVAGDGDQLATGGRPSVPRTTVDINSDEIAHGVLMVGGTFEDLTGFDPVVTGILTEENYLTVENDYPIDRWYPVAPNTVNRLLTVDGQFQQKLVVVPGQFLADATSSPTKGTLRLYSSMDVEVYTSAVGETDFDSPQIYNVKTTTTESEVTFSVEVTDTSTIERVLVLYRSTEDNSWSSVDLIYDAETETAVGSANLPFGSSEYFVQAVDAAGNVALALDHGVMFTFDGSDTRTFMVYLPAVIVE